MASEHPVEVAALLRRLTVATEAATAWSVAASIATLEVLTWGAAGLETTHANLLHSVTPSIHFGDLPECLDGLVFLLVELCDGLRVRGGPDHQVLYDRPEGCHCGRNPGVHLKVDPIVYSDNTIGQELDFPTGKQHEVYGGDHGHLFARHGPGPNLFSEDEVGNRESDGVPVVRSGQVNRFESNSIETSIDRTRL